MWVGWFSQQSRLLAQADHITLHRLASPRLTSHYQTAVQTQLEDPLHTPHLREEPRPSELSSPHVLTSHKAPQRLNTRRSVQGSRWMRLPASATSGARPTGPGTGSAPAMCGPSPCTSTLWTWPPTSWTCSSASTWAATWTACPCSSWSR